MVRNTEVYRAKSIKLLKKYNLYSAPIDIKKLANELDIKVKYEKLDSDVSGKIIYNPNLIDDVTIYINNSENELRQNFSLAHEIAHYIYDIDFSDNKVEIKDSNIFLRSDTVNPIEKRANKYAERLLMPKTLFEAELLTIKDELFPGVKNSELGVKRIYIITKNLSERFKVSIPAVIMRLHSLKRISLETKISLFLEHKIQ